MDNDLALKIYIKARATPKVVAAFAERREFDKILIYSKQVRNMTNVRCAINSYTSVETEILIKIVRILILVLPSDYLYCLKK